MPDEILESVEGSQEHQEDVLPETSIEITFPDDYVDLETFQTAIDAILDALDPEEIEEEILLDGVEILSAVPYAAVGSAYGLPVPDNRVVYYLNDDVQLVFPDEAADSLELVNGYLLNFSNQNIVGNAVLSGSGQTTYYMSTITIPPYGSTNYATYTYNYGYPYMITDCYRYYAAASGYSLRTVTRTSSAILGTGTITAAPWQGFSGDRMYGFIFAVVVIVLLLWRGFRWSR